MYIDYRSYVGGINFQFLGVLGLLSKDGFDDYIEFCNRKCKLVS